MRFHEGFESGQVNSTVLQGFGAAANCTQMVANREVKVPVLFLEESAQSPLPRARGTEHKGDTGFENGL